MRASNSNDFAHANRQSALLLSLYAWSNDKADKIFDIACLREREMAQKNDKDGFDFNQGKRFANAYSFAFAERHQFSLCTKVRLSGRLLPFSLVVVLYPTLGTECISIIAPDALFSLHHI